jgi:hypothetical protein
MTKCTMPTAAFPRCKGRQILASFDGGDVTSDGGILLLRQLDREMGLTRAVARRLSDGRDPQRCLHRTETLVRQRVFGLALGYEDLNDHHALRHDIALQTAVDTDGVLASQSTLCRFEQQADRDWAITIHEEMIEQFIRSFRRPPKKPLYLDFDATDDRVHGQQLGRHFNGYYDHYIFLPLFVFCGDQLLASYLRPAYRDAAHHAGGILALLVRRLRQEWPEVKIVFRGDSGFCRPLILNWCDRHGVDYIIGLAGNKRLGQAGSGHRLRVSHPLREDLGEAACLRLPLSSNPPAGVASIRATWSPTCAAACGVALRQSLLRPGRDGEPHQGAAVPVLRPAATNGGPLTDNRTRLS